MKKAGTRWKAAALPLMVFCIAFMLSLRVYAEEGNVTESEQSVQETERSESEQSVQETERSESEQSVQETERSESEQSVQETELSESEQSVQETELSESGQSEQESTDLVSGNGLTEDITGELIKGYDFTSENAALQEYFPELGLTMEELLERLLSEGTIFSPAEIAAYLLERVRAEGKAFQKLFFMICLCAVLSAAAQNLAGICENRQALQIGFFMIYLILAFYLMQAFITCLSLSRQSLQSITGFLNIFLPAYYLSVGLSIGPTSSAGFYRLSMIAVYVAEYIYYLLLIPCASFYFLIAVSSGASPGDRMASLLQMLKKGMQVVMKTAMAAVGSLGAIRMLILPAADDVSYGTAKKLLSMIPGIGTVSDITVQMVGGSLLLIKNGIGIVICFLLAALAALPLLRLLVIAVLLRLGSAVTWMTGAVNLARLSERTSSAVLLLLKITGSGYALNLLVIGIVAACR